MFKYSKDLTFHTIWVADLQTGCLLVLRFLTTTDL